MEDDKVVEQFDAKIMELDNRLNRLTDVLDTFEDRVYRFMLEVEDALVTVLRVLKSEELLTYDDYADFRETLSGIRKIIHEMEE